MDSLALWWTRVVVPRGRGAVTIETSQPVVWVCEDYRGSTWERRESWRKEVRRLERDGMIHVSVKRKPGVVFSAVLHTTAASPSSSPQDWTPRLNAYSLRLPRDQSEDPRKHPWSFLLQHKHA